MRKKTTPVYILESDNAEIKNLQARIAVKEILVEYLKKHKYDGLCYEGCGCGVENMAPCEYVNFDCVAAYQRRCSCGALIYTPEKSGDVLCDDCRNANDDADEKKTISRAMHGEKGMR